MIRIGWIATAIALAIMAGAWLWLFRMLPPDMQSVPTHWGVDGVPDGFGSRTEALLMLAIMPGAALGAAIVFSLIPLIEPLRANLIKGRRAFLTGWIGMLAIMTLAAIGVALLTARAATGNVDNSEFVRFIVAGVGVLFVALGDALPKTRANFFIGVRTPWTLTSDLAWEKTHRLMGRLFVLVGLWGILAAFILNGVALAFSISGPAVAAALVAVIYSYFVWRGDPERRRSAGDA